MACTNKAGMAVLASLGPLKLGEAKAEEIARLATLDSIKDEIGDWDNTSVVLASNELETFKYDSDTGVWYPNVEVATINGTSWIRRPDGGRLFISKDPLSFVPSKLKKPLLDWTLNRIFTDKTGVIRTIDLANINGPTVIADLNKYFNSDEFYDSLSDEYIMLGDELADPENVKALFNAAMMQMTSYGITAKTQEESLEDGEVTDGITGGFLDKATIDPLARTSERLKLEFARIPKVNDNGDAIVNNDMGAIAEFEDATAMHNLFLKELVDITDHFKDGEFITSAQAMLTKLNTLTGRVPGLKSFIKKLEADETFLADFTSTYSLSLMDFVSVYQKQISGNTEINVGKTGAKDSMVAQIRTRWYGAFKKKMVKSDLLYTTEKTKKIKALHSEIESSNNSTNEIKSLVKIMAAAGIKVKASEASLMVDAIRESDEDTSVYTFFKAMFKPVYRSVDGVESLVADNEVIDPFLEYAKYADVIASVTASFSTDINDATEKGKDGKGYYKFAPSSAIHKALARLKHGDRSLLAKIADHPAYKGSLWIDHLLGNDIVGDHLDKESILVARANKAQAFVFNLAKSEKGAMADNKDMTDTDEVIVQINLAANAFKGQDAGFFTTVPADKAKKLGIRGMPTINDGMGSQGIVFKSTSDFIEHNNQDGFTLNDKTNFVHDGVAQQMLKHYRAEENRILFEREAYLNHIQKVVEEVKERETRDGIKLEGADYKATFDRVMGELDGGKFQVIEKYHYRGQYLDTTSAELRDVVESGDAVRIKAVMTGRAYEFSVFQEVHSETSSPSDAEVVEALKKSLALRYVKMLNDLTGTVIDVAESGYITSKYVKGENIHDVLQFWFFNNMNANIEFAKMFTGDLALYKDAVDYFKRVPASYTDGQYLALLDGTISEQMYNVSIIKDMEMPSKYVDEIRQAFTKDGQEELADGYVKAINRGDGQGFITPNRWKFIMKRLGKLDKATEDLFDRMVNDPYSLTSDELHDASMLLKPMKGVNSGINAEYNTPTQKFLKYSQAVIIPAFAEGTPLQDLLYEMDPAYRADGTYDINYKYTDDFDSTTHEVVFESGIKAGGSNATQIHDAETGELFEDFALRPSKYYNSDWKLQQDLPDKGLHPTLVASQIQANIKADIKKNEMYTIPGYGDISGQQVLDILDTITGQLSDIGIAKAKREFGMDENGDITDKGTFRKALMKQIESSASPAELAALQTGQNIESIVSLAGKSTSIIMSNINKAAVKFKTNGGSFIQVSGVFSRFSKDEANGVLFFDKEFDGELTPPIPIIAGGKQRGQALLGYSSVAKYLPMNPGESFEDYGDRFREKMENGFFPKEMFEVAIGYRIPNQNMSSNDSLKIVGILPPTLGDGIVLYDEIVTKTGSDFDIDKMYVMLHEAKASYNSESVFKNKKAIYNYLDDLLSDDATLDEFRAYAANNLGLTDTEIDDVFGTNGDLKGGDRFVMLRDAVIQSFIDGKLADVALNDALTEATAEYVNGYYIPNATLNLIEELAYAGSPYANSPTRTYDINVTPDDKGVQFHMETADNREFTLVFSENEDVAVSGDVNQTAAGVFAMDLMMAYPDVINAVKAGEDFGILPEYQELIEDVDRSATVRTIQKYISDFKYGQVELSNALVSMYRGVLESEHTSASVLAPLDFDWMPNMVEGLGLADKALPEEDLLMLDPIYQIRVKQAYAAGKAGIGQSANHVSSHPIFQAHDVELSAPLSVDLGLSSLSNELEVPFESSKETYDFYKNGKGEQIKISTLKITQSLSSFLNAYVDIAKDPYVTAANFNNRTFNAAALLLRAGIQKEVVLALIASQKSPTALSEDFIFKTNLDQASGDGFDSDGINDSAIHDNFDDEGNIDDSDNINDEAAINEDSDNINEDAQEAEETPLNEKLIWDKGGKVYLTVEQMLKYVYNGNSLTGDELINEDTGERMELDDVRAAFEATYEHAASVARDLTKTMRAHKLNEGVGITVTGMIIQQNEMNFAQSAENKISHGTVNAMTAPGTGLGKQWDNIMGTLDNLGDVSLQFHPVFKEFLNNITGSELEIGDRLLGEYFEREAMKTVFAREDFNLSNSNYLTEIFGNQKGSLADKVTKARKKHEGNIFLQRLEIDNTDPNYAFITFPKLAYSNPAIKTAYQDSFLEIEQIDPTLYEHLLQFAAYSTGLGMQFGSFEQYIHPEAAYSHKFDRAYDNIKRDMESHFNEELIRDIYINNPSITPYKNLSGHSFNITWTGDKVDKKITALQKQLAKNGYDILSKVKDNSTLKGLPGHNMKTIKKKGGWAPAFMGLPRNKFNNGESIVRTTVFEKSGPRTVMYELAGIMDLSTGQPFYVYSQIEAKGYRSKKGRTIKEYNTPISNIESNHYKGYEGKPVEVMRNNMADMAGALTDAIQAINKKDKKGIDKLCRT